MVKTIPKKKPQENLEVFLEVMQAQSYYTQFTLLV